MSHSGTSIRLRVRLGKPHPPIWVGGASDAALRRTVRYGDGWHPIRIRVSDFRETDIPRLQEMADREQMPMPALCPRIRLRITESPMPDDQRIAGEGSLDQIRADLEGLQGAGLPVRAPRHVLRRRRGYNASRDPRGEC